MVLKNSVCYFWGFEKGRSPVSEATTQEILEEARLLQSKSTDESEKAELPVCLYIIGRMTQSCFCAENNMILWKNILPAFEEEPKNDEI